MKAAVVEKKGASAKFKIKELVSPSIKNGQVLIRNYASSVNPIDVMVQNGKSLLSSAGFSDQVIGSDFCGKVIQSRSRLFKEGDEVYGMLAALKGGAYAEELAVDASQVALKPQKLSYLEAAVIPLVGLTAYQALFKVGRLQGKENVLITGCTGGVGSAAVQLASTIDCHISGLCSEQHRSYAKSIGCDVVIDYQNQRIPSGARFDLIFDAAGMYTYSDLKHHLNEQGLFVTTRGEMNTLKGLVKTAVDVVFEPNMKFVFVKPKANDLRALRDIIERGDLKLHIEKVFNLGQLTEALSMKQKGGFVGKIAVDIGG
ncbi:NAD(P)-dependent alcohol dehydrogenase [Olivibacter sp. XZL3]|uniref:NAD(P)-dependent alcohol dehydrogenase n=1 Tax=Olivibacter sp. XZL3 TaxID=1735116 RepID=UPI0010654A0D|nr:NAD(P)-dependent alcohol dehydrogenase [Olivibacter sp. XZL3]